MWKIGGIKLKAGWSWELSQYHVQNWMANPMIWKAALEFEKSTMKLEQFFKWFLVEKKLKIPKLTVITTAHVYKF